jgi:hypothetical protein
VQGIVRVHLGLPAHLGVLTESRVGTNKQVYRVVKRLEERFGHIDDSPRDYIFLFFTKKFLLFERLKLRLLELGLSPPLLQDALVLAARPEDLVCLEGVEVGHLREGEFHILHLLKVKGLHMLEGLQIVKGYRRVRLHFLHEGGDVSLVFKGELQLGGADNVGIERELEFHVLHVIFMLVVYHSNVLSVLPVLNYHASAVSSGADTFLLQLPLDFGKSLTSSVPGNQHICGLKPDANQATAHSKVIILKGVPFRWVGKF